MISLISYKATPPDSSGYWLRLTAEHGLDRLELTYLEKELWITGIEYGTGQAEITRRQKITTQPPFIEIRVADPETTAPAASGTGTMETRSQS